MNRIKLYRVGSDPEFVFGHVVDGQVVVEPAIKIVSIAQQKQLTSFIGTDSHPATAELRPHPTRNVYRMLYEIALALDHADTYLKSSRKWQHIRMFAQPYYNSPPGHENQGGEHIGGHVHTSFFVDDPDIGKLYAKGLWAASNGTIHYIDKEKEGLEWNLSEPLLNSIHKKAMDGSLWTPDTYVFLMNYLLLPLERFCQNWTLRKVRNSHYGTHGDKAVRVNASKPDKKMAESLKGWSYQHYEYRVPSSWLTHPWLAYSYFALVKYTMLNTAVVQRLAAEDFIPEEWEKHPLGANHKYKELLLKRLADLNAAGARKSADLLNIDKAIDQISAHREEWVNPSQPIITGAWKELLA